MSYLSQINGKTIKDLYLSTGSGLRKIKDMYSVTGEGLRKWVHDTVPLRVWTWKVAEYYEKLPDYLNTIVKDSRLGEGQPVRLNSIIYDANSPYYGNNDLGYVKMASNNAKVETRTGNSYYGNYYFGNLRAMGSTGVLETLHADDPDYVAISRQSTADGISYDGLIAGVIQFRADCLAFSNIQYSKTYRASYAGYQNVSWRYTGITGNNRAGWLACPALFLTVDEVALSGIFPDELVIYSQSLTRDLEGMNSSNPVKYFET